jgi:hypothetical protein
LDTEFWNREDDVSASAEDISDSDGKSPSFPLRINNITQSDLYAVECIVSAGIDESQVRMRY